MKNQKLKYKRPILFPIASKNINYLGINPIKDVQYLYIKNYKILVKEIKDYLNKLITVLMIWITLLRYQFSPNGSIDSIQSQSESQRTFCRSGCAIL